jgi:hypothetical protein
MEDIVLVNLARMNIAAIEIFTHITLNQYSFTNPGEVLNKINLIKSILREIEEFRL